MTEAQIVETLKRKQGARTLTALAQEIGITVGYLHDVYTSRRAPGPKILAFLKLEKREEYVRAAPREGS